MPTGRITPSGLLSRRDFLRGGTEVFTTNVLMTMVDGEIVHLSPDLLA